MKLLFLLISIFGFLVGGEQGLTIGLLSGMFFTGLLFFGSINSIVKRKDKGYDKDKYEEVTILREKKK